MNELGFLGALTQLSRFTRSADVRAPALSIPFAALLTVAGCTGEISSGNPAPSGPAAQSPGTPGGAAPAGGDPLEPAGQDNPVTVTGPGRLRLLTRAQLEATLREWRLTD